LCGVDGSVHLVGCEAVRKGLYSTLAAATTSWLAIVPSPKFARALGVAGDGFEMSVLPQIRVRFKLVGADSPRAIRDLVAAKLVLSDSGAPEVPRFLGL
jgi:hypothetical protein